MENTHTTQCPSCGSGSFEQFSKSQFRCLMCKTVFDDQNYTAQPVEYELDLKDNLLDLKAKEELIPVGNSKRLLNYIVDSLSIVIIAVLFEGLGIKIFNDVMAIYLMLIVYYLLMEGAFGQTIGKFVTRTKVVDMEGEKPNAGKIVLRTLCRFIPFDALSGLFSNNVFWHDSISKTRVVEM